MNDRRNGKTDGRTNDGRCRTSLAHEGMVTGLSGVTLSEQGEQMLQEALADVAAGNVREHETAESLIAELRHDEDGAGR